MSLLYWHAGLMALAWLVLLPVGGLVARFFKVRPGQGFPERLDDRFWWDSHRAIQSAGAILAAWGFWLAYNALDRHIDWDTGHVRLGLAALALCAAQMVSPLFRGTKGGPTDEFADPADPLTWRGDHYDMTLRRRLFEAWHKHAGYAAMLLAAAAAWTGIELAGLDSWLQWALVGVVLGYVAIFLLLTRRGRRVDTWLAIWGPDGR